MGLKQAMPAALGRPAQARFGLGTVPDASRSIVNLLPFAYGPLTSSSPRFWIELLVVQDSASSVQIPEILFLHIVILGSFGVMFTSSVDLCRAS
jgi:hypothetical protein